MVDHHVARAGARPGPNECRAHKGGKAVTKGMKIALGCGIVGVLGLVAALIIAVAAGIWLSRRSATTRSDAPSASTETTPPRTASRYVLIDAQEPAYTVYSAFPAAKLREMQQKTAGQSGAEIVDWDTFKESANQRITARIKRYDSSPESQLVGEVVDLIDTGGAPIGLTWNGGIAITYTDYQAAKAAYEEAQ
jgi:hypothetical protein